MIIAAKSLCRQGEKVASCRWAYLIGFPILIRPPFQILKSVWSRLADGSWGITDLNGLTLKPIAGYSETFFKLDWEVNLLTTRPSNNPYELFSSFGSTEFLLRQSILPVVSWRHGDEVIRCVGTASVISCTGYLLTAAHVLMDPFEQKNGVIKKEGKTTFCDDFEFGVLIPYQREGSRGILVCPFEKLWIWGHWEQSPLLNQNDRFNYTTDIAVCKIPPLPLNAAYQPFAMSLNAFVKDEAAYAIGYAEMDDIPISYKNGQLVIAEFNAHLFVSIGEVMQVFSDNHLLRDVPTPGPCFDFCARIPGKMSGAPIFGARGAVIRGVVSRSFSGESHAYGAMLGPGMNMPLDEPNLPSKSLYSLMIEGNEGIAQLIGEGL
ncbi:MAG: hypothetical protein FD175_2861 [Beijerinckiaceae bacterium]|nr:MAG: hypothetical protein FD175_2861 [Beijerinckiaceae bacterium]